MSAPRRPGRLHLGDRVRYAGASYVVTRLVGSLVILAEPLRRGPDLAIQLTDLQRADDFAIVGGVKARAPVPPAGVLEGLPAHVVERAYWWERHVLQVIYGQVPDVEGASPLPQYDPALTSISQRERAKAAELTGAGLQIAAITVKRQRQRYEAGGLRALVDGRMTKPVSRTGRVDPRVVEAMREAICQVEQDSTRTASFIFWRTEQILAARFGDAAPPLPPHTSAYRLFGRLADKHTLGSARTRRSLAAQPDGPFGHLQVDAPGEVMQIDTTPLDVMVLLPDGVIGRVELTGMIDVATRTVTAAVLSPTTKAVDASVLLARTVTPEPMRPGWIDALRMQYSVLPHRRLLDIDARVEHAAARPVIVPDTIVCDHGNVFISHNFRASCRFLGISYQPTHEASGFEKPHIERMFSSVGTLFAQFVAGYTGPNAERRGYKVHDRPLWSQIELQELLDEWLIACWQNRPHDGLRDPETPGRAFTPNEKYAALVETAGYVPVALTADDYIELLPATWRAINSYGVRINHRTYDCAELNRWRKQPSGVTAKHDLWEVHRDPYAVAHVWVRNHWEGGWITLTWKHLNRAPMPFGDMAWDHVRAGLPRTATEEQIADAVQALLAKAHQGPDPQQPPRLSARDRRVAARTKTTSSQPRPFPTPTSGDKEPHNQDDSDVTTEHLAKVIPLSVFDPYEEADRQW
jgi:Mu transposase, C-terminal